MTPLPIVPWKIHNALQEHPEFMSAEQLASYCRLSIKSVQPWVKRLEASELITRANPDKSRRGCPRKIVMVNNDTNRWVNVIIGCEDL